MGRVGDRVVYYAAGEPDPRLVRVMAIAEGYAMVRRPRAMPYVVSLKELYPPVSTGNTGNESSDGDRQ